MGEYLFSGLIVLLAIVVGILHLIGQNNLNLAPTVTIALGVYSVG